MALLVVLGLAASPTGASPAAQGEGCIIKGDKVVSPARVRLGEKVQVRLTRTPECPPASYRAADIVLAIDRSRSMKASGKLTAAKNAAREFVGATDLTLHQVAVVAFHAAASVEIGLSQDAQAIADAIDGLYIRSGTDIAAALDVAYEELQLHGRADALPVIILISDGSPNRPPEDPQTAAVRSANAAKLGGVQIFTVGLGTDADEDLLKELASSDGDYYYSPGVADLEAIYRSIAILLGDFALRDLVVDDTLFADVELVDGSAVSSPAVSGKDLRWASGLVAATGMTWLYQVVPQRVGTYPTNEQAVATYTDIDAARRQFEFPQPLITVLAPEPDAPCDQPGGWTIMVHSFPDSVGVSGSDYAGCNNRFDSGDWIQGTGNRLPPLEFELTDIEGQQVMYRGRGVPGPGRVDQRLYIRVCQPPPYLLRLVTEDLDGYHLCPNSPEPRLITERSFRPLVFQRTEVRFGLVR